MDVCDECGSKIKNYVFLRYMRNRYMFCSENCLKDFIKDGKLIEDLVKGDCCGG